MAKSIADKTLERVREAATDPNVRRAASAAAAAAGVGAAAKVAKATLDLRSAAHAPEHDRDYALKAGEPLAPGLRRIARGQIDDILECLSAFDATLSPRAVHESRKALKRLRAMTRLLRGELGPDRYVAENAALRDTARRLSAARDAEVMVDTLESVIEHDLDAAPGTGTAALRAELIVERQIAVERLTADGEAITAATGEVRAARGRAAHWVRPQAGFDAVAPGLDRIYSQGRRRAGKARRDPTPENLHDWRKRVKDLRHAAEILAPAGPKRMRRIAQRADNLGELLGSEHDLSVLAELVHGRAELFADQGELRRLTKAIDRRRAKLRRQALARGRKLYEKKPKRFVRQTAEAWEASESG